MKKIVLYIAASIDGYIARSNGDLDWLMEYPITPDFNYGYDEFFESVDTVNMGGRTYRDILSMDVIWPYKDKNTYILTHNPIKTNENIQFITDNFIERVIRLREENGKNIWLVGGGEIISMLLNHNLIDEMIITTIPVILGDGVPLFPNSPKESKWELLENQSYSNGVTQAIYKIKRD